MRNATVLIILTVLLGFSMVSSQTSPSVVADNVATGSPLYYNHTPNIARSSTGDLVTVWKSVDKQIVFSKYDASFMTWSPAVPLSNAGDRAEKAGMAADDAGNIYCVWQQRETSGEDYGIFFTKFDGANWTTPVNLTGNNFENEEASIAVDDMNNIFVAWNTDSEKDTISYVFCIKSTDGGTTWSTSPDTLSSLDGNIGGTSGTSGRPVLATATGGKMVCVWHEEPDGHPDRESFMNQYDGSKWLNEIVHIDVADSANSMYPAVAVDSHDNIYMVYVSFGSPFKFLLKKKAWGDAAWAAQTDTIGPINYGITKPYLATDSNDNFYMVFRTDHIADTSHGLENIAYITSSDGITWSDAVVLNRENYDAGYATLAPRIRDTGVDVLWRESYLPNLDDADTTAIVYGHIGLLTDIRDTKPQLANKFRLDQNYPNPFNPTTQITFNIAQTGIFELAVYDLTGRKIQVLESGKISAGQHVTKWDATNDSGKKVASGIYFYQLEGKNTTITKKMVFVK